MILEPPPQIKREKKQTHIVGEKAGDKAALAVHMQTHIIQQQRAFNDRRRRLCESLLGFTKKKYLVVRLKVCSTWCTMDATLDS